MLVLSRRLGEGIMLGNAIRIKVLELTSSGVKLGFEAPPHVSIYRDELYAEIAAANRAAAEDAESQLADPSEG